MIKAISSCVTSLLGCSDNLASCDVENFFAYLALEFRPQLTKIQTALTSCLFAARKLFAATFKIHTEGFVASFFFSDFQNKKTLSKCCHFKFFKVFSCLASFVFNGWTSSENSPGFSN